MEWTVGIATIVITAIIALTRVCEIRLRMLDLCIKHGIHRDEEGDISQTLEQTTTKGGKIVSNVRNEDIEKYLVNFDIPFKEIILGKFYTELFLKAKEVPPS